MIQRMSLQRPIRLRGISAIGQELRAGRVWGMGRCVCRLFFFFFSYLINADGTAGRDVRARLMVDQCWCSGGGMTKGTCNS